MVFQYSNTIICMLILTLIKLIKNINGLIKSFLWDYTILIGLICSDILSTVLFMCLCMEKFNQIQFQNLKIYFLKWKRDMNFYQHQFPVRYLLYKLTFQGLRSIGQNREHRTKLGAKDKLGSTGQIKVHRTIKKNRAIREHRTVREHKTM